MRVRLITTMCGSDGCHSAGNIVDVSGEEAAELIEGGYAIPADSPRKVPVAIEETATLATQEKAVIARKRR